MAATTTRTPRAQSKDAGAQKRSQSRWIAAHGAVSGDVKEKFLERQATGATRNRSAAGHRARSFSRASQAGGA
jgi:hypothetical protein